MTAQRKTAIVVLTPGRSGSSLLMQALQAMGLSMSDHLIPPSVDNPDGYFEDAEVVDLHKRVGVQFGIHSHSPADNALDGKLAQVMRPELERLLDSRLKEGCDLWAVKDPRMVYYLPAWEGVFRTRKIVPLYILALRHPEAALRSLMTSSGPAYPAGGAELVWLIRVFNALERTAGNCFIVHYEDWFSNPHDLMRELASYTGLGPFDVEEIDSLVSGMVKIPLNRAIHRKYHTKNKYILHLYEQLRTCRYMQWDRVPIMDTIANLREDIDTFVFWHQRCCELHLKAAESAHKYRVSQGELRAITASYEELQKIHIAENSKSGEMQEILAAQVKKNAALVMEQKELSELHRTLSLTNEELAYRIGVLEDAQAQSAADNEQLVLLNNAQFQTIRDLEDARDSLLKQLQAEKALNMRNKVPPQKAKQATASPAAGNNPAKAAAAGQVKPAAAGQVKPAQQQKEKKPQPSPPAEGGFPNLPQRMVLVFYQPFLRLFLTKDAWQRYLKKRSRFFARTQSTPNKILRFFLKGLGPAPKDENPA